MVGHCEYVPHFLIHSFVKRHLGCFHFLAIVDRETINVAE